MAASRRASATRPRRSLAISDWAAWCASNDDNHITIDGPTELAYTDDVRRRFEAYGWHVVALGEEANDVDALEGGLRERRCARTDQPSVVILRSHIGWP